MSDECPDCKANRWRVREFARIRDDAAYWRRQAETNASKVARLELDAKHREFRDQTDVAWLQGKVVAQRRELKRLNDAQNARRIREDFEPQPDVEVQSLTRIEVQYPSETPRHAPPTAPLTPAQPPADHGDGSGAGGGSEGEGGK